MTAGVLLSCEAARCQSNGQFARGRDTVQQWVASIYRETKCVEKRASGLGRQAIWQLLAEWPPPPYVGCREQGVAKVSESVPWESTGLLEFTRSPRAFYYVEVAGHIRFVSARL